MILPITLTEDAKNKINGLCAANTEHFGVHLSLKGGGCAGFEYDWGMIAKESVEPNDEIINTGTGNLVINAMAHMYLFDCTIDYETDVFQTQFVISNPNASSACGCGISVNFDMEAVEKNNELITELT
ncbi:MAG: HesB/IscA family protein [Methylophagaceae bacterium]|jgi:iron-sulfur cluster assembly accessory protein|tara:strand:+ start:85 stop:468 length:384 start_codon:yes stop_codon:yes gene_type:complete